MHMNLLSHIAYWFPCDHIASVIWGQIISFVSAQYNFIVFNNEHTIFIYFKYNT